MRVVVNDVSSRIAVERPAGELPVFEAAVGHQAVIVEERVGPGGDGGLGILDGHDLVGGGGPAGDGGKAQRMVPRRQAINGGAARLESATVHLPLGAGDDGPRRQEGDLQPAGISRGGHDADVVES